MFRLRKKTIDTAIPLFRNSYINEWVGFLVLSASIVFIAAIIEAGVLKQWLTPSTKIYFLLPQNGLAGLAVGNDIEIMGVKAGEIRHLELNSSGRLFAVGIIESQFKHFVRKTSHATIKRRFVVTGSSYIDISRGGGDDLDWGYAVLNTVTEPNPADIAIKTIEELHSILLPTMRNAEDITHQINDIISNIRAGKGTAGSLITDSEIINRVNLILSNLNSTIKTIEPLEEKMNTILLKANKAITVSMPDVKKTLHYTSVSSEQLPTLLVEAETTTNSIRRLSEQLQSVWYLGGSKKHKEKDILPVSEALP